MTGMTGSLIGSVLADRYRIDALLGEGGMGAVYRGHHLHLRRDFAIKVLHHDITRDPDISRRFEREAQSAARLDHPNCIQVTEFGTTDDGTRYMVMQLLEGRELNDLIRGPMAPLRALDLFLQLLAGLEHAHGRGVIHRDLKPQNVFVCQEGDDDPQEVVKIVDFGIAKLVSGEGSGEAMTRAGMVFGTPLYMSPEQCLGVEVDARSDLYSAGILLYLMLSGKLPFVSDDPVAVIRMQVSQEPPPLPASVPEELVAIVRRLLTKQRDNRFPDAKTVRAILTSYRARLAAGEAGGSGSAASTMRGAQLGIGPSPTVGLPAALQPRERRILGGLGFWLVGLGLLLGFAAVVWFLGQGGEGGEDGQDGQEGQDPPSLEAEVGKDGLEDRGPDDDDDDDEPAPADEELAAIDAAFREHRYDEGVLLLGPLRERFPGNAGLLWREGWLLHWRDNDRPAALTRYRDALLRDPELADNQAFVRDLVGVLSHPEVRVDAVDLALTLGSEGRELLRSFVNDSEIRLGFVDRHRILRALGGDVEVDEALNLRLDLEQFREAPRPCVALREALEAIVGDPDPSFVDPLAALDLPRPAAEAATVEQEACAALPDLLAEARAAVSPKRKKRAKRRPAPTPSKKKKTKRR